MITKIETPKNKQELIKSLQSAPIKSVEVFEGSQISNLPAKGDLIRQKATVIILKS